MIKANELRIGNWVIGPIGELMKVNVLGHFSEPNYIHATGGGTSGQNGFEPIPLTTEILKKCGFHKLNKEWVLKDHDENPLGFHYSIWQIFDDNDFLYNSAEFNIELLHLHQLQNHYFFVTGGKELEVKL